MRRGIVCLLLVAGGCQKLFSLRHVGDDDGSADARTIDTALDTGSGSGSGSSTSVCANPRLRTDIGDLLANSIDQVTISEDQNRAIGVAAGGVFVMDPLATGAITTVSGIAGSSWSYPALSPDGGQLLLANADGYVWRSANTGPPASWAAPMHAPGFLMAQHPGTMGVAADHTLRVVVAEGSMFREYAYDGASWTMAPSTSSAVDLTGSSGSAISDPALTSDATMLVFVVTNGAGGTSVQYVRRADTSLASKFQMTGSPGTGTILTDIGLATPYLADDCTLYVVRTGELLRYAP